MVFDETFIDMVWRTIANNFYSIIINHRTFSIFQFFRGRKQGYPFSPAIFSLGAEMLSSSLNNIHNHHDYHAFVMERRFPQVNHLSFADDTILFTSKGLSHFDSSCRLSEPMKILLASLLTVRKVTSWFIKMCLTQQRQN